MELNESPYHDYPVSYVKKGASMDMTGKYKPDEVEKARLDLRKSPNWHPTDVNTKEPLRIRKLIRSHPDNKRIRSSGYNLHSYDHNVSTN